jgi:hypothetical protein
MKKILQKISYSLFAMLVGVLLVGGLLEVPHSLSLIGSRISGRTVVYESVRNKEEISIAQKAYSRISNLFGSDERLPPPEVSATSFVVGNVDTGEILAELNSKSSSNVWNFRWLGFW